MTSGGGFIAGSIIARLLLDKTGWNQAISQVVGADAAKLKGTAKEVGQVYKDIGSQMTQAGIGIGLFGGAILGAVTTGVKAFATFDAAMTESLAIMGDVSDALRRDLVGAAREVARETTFTAAEAAKAYYYLASAGYSAAESVKTLPVVSKFAQAGMFDLAQATSLLADAQSALGLRIRDDAVANMKNMTRVADVLSKANIMANASIQQFAESLTTRAGAALRLVNKDVEEGVAVLAAFADQGVKGAEAGTRLDIVLRDLQTRAIENKAVFEQYGVQVFDSAGELRNMADVIGDLEKALAGASDEQKRSILMQMQFSDRSVASILNLVGMSDAIRRYEAELRKAGGTTEDIAQRQLQTLNAQLKLTQNAVSGMAASFGETLVPALTKVVEKIRETATEVAALAREHPKLAAAAAFGAGGLGVLFTAAAGGIIVLGTLLRSLGSIISSAGLLRMIVGKAFTFTFNVVGAGVVIAWILKVREDMKKLTEEGVGFWGKLEAFIKGHNPFKGLGREGLGEFLLAMEQAKKGVEEIVETALPAGKNLAAQFKPVADTLFDLAGALKEFGLKTRTELTNELNFAERALAALLKSTEKTPAAIEALKEKIAELKEQLYGAKTETTRLAEALRVELIPSVENYIDRTTEKLVELALKVNSEIKRMADYTADDMEASLARISDGWKKTDEQGKRSAEEIRTAWAETTDQMAKAFGEAFADIIRDGLNFADFFKNLMQGIVNVAATFVGKQLSTLFTNFFTKLGAQAGGAFSGFSASANAAAFGIAAGFAAMWAGIGLGMLQSKREWDEYWDEVIEDARRAGKEIVEVINSAMLSESGGGGGLLDPDKIIYESEWEQALDLIRDAIGGLKTATDELDDAWSTLLAHAKEAGETSSKWLIDLIRQFREAGKYSKELNDYVLGLLDTVPEALKVLVDQVKIVAQDLGTFFEGEARNVLGYIQELGQGAARNVQDIAARLADLGDIAVLTFNAMIASGKSWLDAVEALRPALSALREKYKQLGIDAGASLAHLFRIVGVTEKHKDLFEAIDATRQILIALGDSVWLNADAWETLTGDIVSQFHALRHGGLSVEDSLRAMVPSLQAIVNYAAAYGFELDKQTQYLVDQARAHGWIKEAQKTEANILVEGFNRVCDVLIRIAEVLGADVSDLMTDISTTAGTFYKTSDDTVTCWKEIGGVLVPFNEDLKEALELAKKLGIAAVNIGTDLVPHLTTHLTGGGTGFGVSKFQEGGIAWTHQLAEVGEVRPEIIMDLEKFRESKRPFTLNLSVSAIDAAGVERFLRRDARPILQDMLDHEDLRTPEGGGL